MADVLKLKKGLLANLDKAELDAGSLYITTDEVGLYIDVAQESGDVVRSRIGDLVVLNSLAEWEALPRYSETALYYITNGNMLLKYSKDGVQTEEGLKHWVQINSVSDSDSVAQTVTTLQTTVGNHSLQIGANAEAAENAQSTADQAAQAAAGAQSTADQAATDASKAKEDAADALSKANAANTAASNADANASEAKTKAESALTAANEAKTAANEAKTTATGAATTAGEAKGLAESAGLKADAASTTANNALGIASTANANAEEAKSDANEAKANAATAVSTANTASTTAGEAKDLAESADSKADAASTAANNALSQAGQAVETANAASETANAAKEDASKAKEDASKAKEDAANALSKADAANTAAGNANTNANEAKANAAAAVETANNASSVANEAKSTAESAATVAGEAKTLAEAADAKAVTAQTTADNALAKANANEEAIAALQEKDEEIEELIADVNSMTFKGIVEASLEGNVLNLPSYDDTTVKAGDTYVVSGTMGYYYPGGHLVSDNMASAVISGEGTKDAYAGDLIIATSAWEGNDPDTENINNNIRWYRIESGFSSNALPTLTASGNQILLNQPYDPSSNNGKQGALTFVEPNENEFGIKMTADTNNNITLNLIWGEF